MADQAAVFENYNTLVIYPRDLENQTSSWPWYSYHSWVFWGLSNSSQAQEIVVMSNVQAIRVRMAREIMFSKRNHAQRPKEKISCLNSGLAGRGLAKEKISGLNSG